MSKYHYIPTEIVNLGLFVFFVFFLGGGGLKPQMFVIKCAANVSIIDEDKPRGFSARQI